MKFEFVKKLKKKNNKIYFESREVATQKVPKL